MREETKAWIALICYTGEEMIMRMAICLLLLAWTSVRAHADDAYV